MPREESPTLPLNVDVNVFVPFTYKVQAPTICRAVLAEVSHTKSVSVSVFVALLYSHLPMYSGNVLFSEVPFALPIRNSSADTLNNNVSVCVADALNENRNKRRVEIIVILVVFLPHRKRSVFATMGFWGVVCILWTVVTTWMVEIRQQCRRYRNCPQKILFKIFSHNF